MKTNETNFLIECLIERDGPTEMIVPGDTKKYMFSKNEAGDYVCPVVLRKHREYLLGLSDFRVYEAAVEKSETPDSQGVLKNPESERVFHSGRGGKREGAGRPRTKGSREV
jgi:hypothetical protein